MSSTRLVGDICAPVGKYMQDGVEKTRWRRCGALLQNDEGKYRINMELFPAVSDPESGCWLAVFEKDSQQQKPAKPAATPDPDENIPF
jgi:hypothetical protein